MIKNRYRRILSFFAGVLIGLLWWEVVLPKLGFRKTARRKRDSRFKSYARQFHDLAVDMGGVLIKVGQWLSARLDVLPPIITDELIGLQDEVLPEKLEDVRRVIEAEFGTTLEDLFLDFSPEPIASASIGQVHTARLNQGGEGDQPAETTGVVVKVQRPEIERVVETDLAALRVVIGWLELYGPIRRRVDVKLLLREFSGTLYEELDYLHEAKNAQTFRENFHTEADIVVPEVHWSRTSRRVLTLEDVRAIKITDYAGLEAAGLNRAEISQRLFDVYLKQIFTDRFFHADPHPGNLFVLPRPQGESGHTPFSLVFVDFGMAGQIMPNVVNGLRELIIAVVGRDSERVIKGYQIMRVLLPGADLDLLKMANDRAFDRFWGLTTPELMELGPTEAMAFLDEFRGLVYNNPFQLPENMILLGRALTILNGICTGLDEKFNVWLSVVPWADKLLKADGSSQWKIWAGEAADVLRSVAALPRRAESILTRLEQGRLEVKNTDLSHQVNRVSKSVRSLADGIFFSAFLFGGIQLFLADHTTLAYALWVGAVITLIRRLFFARSG